MYSISFPISLRVLRLIPLVCFAIAGVVAFFAVYELYSASRMAKWPTVNGVVISSNVDLGRSADGVYAPAIRYRYAVGSASYVGDQFEASPVYTSNRRAVAALVEQYPAGKTVTVYYDPQNPSAAILDPAGKSGVWLLAIIAVGLGAVGSIFYVFGFTKAPYALFDWLLPDTGALIRVVPACLAFVFLAVGAGFAVASWNDWKKSTQSIQWPTTNATVLTSRLATRTNSEGGRSYGAHVDFRYQVGGKTYEGDRLEWGQIFSSNPRPAEAILKDYPVGKSITVHYDPNDPAESVVNPSATGSFWFTTLLAIVFAVFGLGALAMFFLFPRIFGPATEARGKGAQ